MGTHAVLEKVGVSEFASNMNNILMGETFSAKMTKKTYL